MQRGQKTSAQTNSNMITSQDIFQLRYAYLPNLFRVSTKEEQQNKAKELVRFCFDLLGRENHNDYRGITGFALGIVHILQYHNETDPLVKLKNLNQAAEYIAIAVELNTCPDANYFMIQLLEEKSKLFPETKKENDIKKIELLNKFILSLSSVKEELFLDVTSTAKQSLILIYDHMERLITNNRYQPNIAKQFLAAAEKLFFQEFDKYSFDPMIFLTYGKIVEASEPSSKKKAFAPLCYFISFILNPETGLDNLFNYFKACNNTAFNDLLLEIKEQNDKNKLYTESSYHLVLELIDKLERHYKGKRTGVSKESVQMKIAYAKYLIYQQSVLPENYDYTVMERGNQLLLSTKADTEYTYLHNMIDFMNDKKKENGPEKNSAQKKEKSEKKKDIKKKNRKKKEREKNKKRLLAERRAEEESVRAEKERLRAEAEKAAENNATNKPAEETVQVNISRKQRTAQRKNRNHGIMLDQLLIHNDQATAKTSDTISAIRESQLTSIITEDKKSLPNDELHQVEVKNNEVDAHEEKMREKVIDKEYSSFEFTARFHQTNEEKECEKEQEQISETGKTRDNIVATIVIDDMTHFVLRKIPGALLTGREVRDRLSYASAPPAKRISGFIDIVAPIPAKDKGNSFYVGDILFEKKYSTKNGSSTYENATHGIRIRFSKLLNQSLFRHACNQNVTVDALYANAECQVIDPIGGFKDLCEMNPQIILKPDLQYIARHPVSLLKLIALYAEGFKQTYSPSQLNPLTRYLEKSEGRITDEQMYEQLNEFFVNGRAELNFRFLLQYNVFSKIYPGIIPEYPSVNSNLILSWLEDRLTSCDRTYANEILSQERIYMYFLAARCMSDRTTEINETLIKKLMDEFRFPKDLQNRIFKYTGPEGESAMVFIQKCIAQYNTKLALFNVEQEYRKLSYDVEPGIKPYYYYSASSFPPVVTSPEYLQRESYHQEARMDSQTQNDALNPSTESSYADVVKMSELDAHGFFGNRSNKNPVSQGKLHKQKTPDVEKDSLRNNLGT